MLRQGWLAAILGAALGACAGGTSSLPPDPTDAGGDSTPVDSGAGDTGAADTTTPDTAVQDSTAPDTAVGDTAPPEDTTATDTAPADTPVADTAPGDTGPSCLPTEMLCGAECVTPMTSLMHCGRCDNRCLGGTNGTPACMGGRCTLTCAAGFNNCDMDAANGCESASATDAMNCGMCGMRCSFANAAATCAMGACALGACAAGFGNCDGMAANGCEADLNGSAMHCGACGTACPMGQMCNMGRCELRCTAPMTVCGSGAMARCANTQTDPTACGSCATACAAPANARATCAAGACGFECNAGFADCDGMAGNGCEVELAASVAHCGRCTNRCAFANAAATCAMGGCALGACNAGFGNCDGMAANGCETDTNSSTTHCGRCMNACVAPGGGTGSCSGGSCATSCPSGLIACGAACVDSRTDNANCGRCGGACAAGEVCTLSACRAVGGPDFRVTALGNAGCSVFDHVSVTGDDRGGIAVSPQRVFYSADGNRSGSFRAGDLGDPATVGAQFDGVVNDLADATVYALLNSAGVAVDVGSSFPFTVTQLGVLDPNTGALTAVRVALSTPIVLRNGTGIFAGYRRFVLHSGGGVGEGRWYNVNLPSGVVTPLLASAQPAHSSCESWAYWGIAEYYGGDLYTIYVQNSTTIVRRRVADGTVTPIGSFTNLSDMCSITFSPQRNRWYFHHEYNSQFGGSPGGETVGFCPAAWDQPAERAFGVVSLGATGCTITDHGGLTGDDRGGIGLSGEHLFYNADGNFGRWSAENMSGGVATAGQLDGVLGDLATGALYVLLNDAGAQPVGTFLSVPFTVSQLGVVDGVSGSVLPGRIRLSAPVIINQNAGLFAGYGALLLHTGNASTGAPSRWVAIDPATGRVEGLREAAVPAHTSCENYGYWGIAERFGGQFYAVYATSSTTITRYQVSTGTTVTLGTFTNLSDMCSLTFSPHRNRWYFHHEYSGGFGTSSGETAGFCPATWSTTPVVPTTHTFPSSGSALGGPTVRGTVGTGASGYQYQSGDFVEETFSRGAPFSRATLTFTIRDFTAGCAVGQPLSWDVLFNGVRAGSFGITGGSGVRDRAISLTITFPAVAAGSFVARIQATTTVCSGGSSYIFQPGGTLRLE
ncbi:MAG: hypothetical protein HY909_31715 [Deltaproteobacteria bacterium]|nr:hypothetical protein [Deltaproteobacteria bacterium]